jgi:hypothetical protein
LDSVSVVLLEGVFQVVAEAIQEMAVQEVVVLPEVVEAVLETAVQEVVVLPEVVLEVIVL